METVKTDEKIWQPSDDTLSEKPQPLFREISSPAEFPLESLGAILAPAGLAIEQAIQAPRALIGQSLLGAAALAVQAHGDVEIDGRVRPTSLFLLTVGQSGERKSAVDAEVLKPHREVEKNKIAHAAVEQNKYEQDLETWETSKRNVTHKSSKKTPLEVNADLSNLGSRPQPPLSEIILMEEPTLEGLQKNLENGQPSVGIFSDEGGRMVGGHSMSEENQMKTAAGISQLWDGSPVSRVRAGDGSKKLYGKRLSIHLMFQERVAEQMTCNDTLRDQGLLSRCLIAAPISTIGNREYKEINLNNDPRIIAYRNRVRDILDLPFHIALNSRNQLEPKKITLGTREKNFWITFHDHIEKSMKDGEKYQNIRGFASKAAEHTLRIAGVLSLTKDIETREIQYQEIQDAVSLMEFYLSEAVRLYDSAILNPDLIKAKKLLEWIHEREHKLIYSTMIYQKGPNYLRSKAQASKCIGILEEHKWLRRIHGEVKIDGALRKEAWEVVYES